MLRIERSNRYEEKRREQLADAQAKARSDVDYIAMMCDVELEEEEEDAQ